MSITFDTAFDRLLGNEGRYTEGLRVPLGANQSSGGHPLLILVAAVEIGTPV